MNRMPYTSIDRETLGPRLSVLGYIKIGGKRDQIRWSRNGPYTLPERYVEPVRFEITTREKDVRKVVHPKDPKSREWKVDVGYLRDETIHGEVGPNPTELKVRLMFDDVEPNLVSHLGVHDGKRWVCQGNGVEAQDVERGKVSCPCPRLKAFEGEYPDQMPKDQLPCKPRGVLSVILEDAETFGGFYVFKTTSWESIGNLRTQLELFREQFGTLAGLPLTLKVYPATKGYGQGEGTTTQPIVTLVLRASFETARQIGAAAAEETKKYLLAAGGTPDEEGHFEVLSEEMREEAESEGSEFHPGAEKVAAAGNGSSVQELNERVKQRQAEAQVVGGEEDDEPPFEIVADDEGPDHEVVEDDAGSAEVSDAEADASGGGTPAGSDDQEESEEEPEPDQEEQVGQRTGKPRSELNKAYFATLSEKAPELYESPAQRKLWQEQKVGKASCKSWEADDFELALLLLERGQTDVVVPEPTDGSVPV